MAVPSGPSDRDKRDLIEVLAAGFEELTMGTPYADWSTGPLLRDPSRPFNLGSPTMSPAMYS
jgi:hypothetical protein